MSPRYEIHPRMGVARLGNSPDEFYLAPETVGGRPIACDSSGNADSNADGSLKFVEDFKDSAGRVKRQAAKFKIFKIEENVFGRNIVGNKISEVKLSDDDIEKITWTVHIANKKPIWYTFSELQGNLEFGPENSYKNQHIPVNNPDVTDGDERQKLIIDPGPRSIDAPGQVVEFSRYNVPDDYKEPKKDPNDDPKKHRVFFPPVGEGGAQIDSLGELRMDKDGHLVALGAYGKVTGSAKIESFRGAAGYWDDIADGFVLATIHFKEGDPIDVDPGWLLVGSPKYAPELVNITTLYDTMYDVAVRHLGYDKTLYAPETIKNFFPPDEVAIFSNYEFGYKVNYARHIKPIFDRIQSYRWVADIPYLSNFANPGFDLSDASLENQENRLNYFRLFRTPLPAEDYNQWCDVIYNGPNQLFFKPEAAADSASSLEGLPMLPLNSGDNSVTNSGPVYKFATLSVTQYFFLYQWAQGNFVVEPFSQDPIEALDEAGVGNCVGAPFSPGIETTWIVRNHPIYSEPFQLKLAHFEDQSNANIAAYYRKHGLSVTADEAEGQGCEPGDLTKRMAIPWQADFQECTVQTPNITNPSINQFSHGIEAPPAYYVYWWPPQSPMHVMTGSVDAGDQVLDALISKDLNLGQSIIPAGQRLPYQRGIESTQDMIDNWSRLGFIINQSKIAAYPYFVESERDNQALGQVAILRSSKS